MSEQTDALTFGPQWIRDLSNGANMCVPPPSPGPTYKLAQFRYGKEEMLALFATQSIVTPPVINSEIGEYILTKDIRQPLSYLPMSEEEQRNQFGSLNSAAVLKILGRGGRGGGRGSTRGGRGSGRGRGEGQFHRGFSVDETTTKGEDGWQPTTSRRLSWGENGRGGFTDRGTREAEPSPRGFELSAPPPGRHKEASRALSSGNWRSTDSGEADDDGGGWTVSGPRGSERADKWRGSTRGGRHNSAEDYNIGGEHGSGERWNDNWNRGSRDRNSFDDLPEWSKSDNVFESDLGSFDSSGAFCVVKDKKKFDDTGQRESIDDKEQKEDWEKELIEDTHGTPVSDSKIDFHDHNKDLTKEDSTDKSEKLEELQENKTEIQQQANAVRENKLTTHPKENKSNSAPVREEKAAGIKPKHTASEASQAEGRNTSVVDSHDKVGADLERVAESCIANLVVECEDVPETQVRPSSVETPSGDSDGDKLRSSPAQDETRWFYRDPQGQEQGPFSSEEMVEWFHHGYFTMQLSIRRECDVMYLPLGEVIKRWQRVPFLPGPAPPPITHQHLVNQQTMLMQQRLLQQHYEELQKHAILQQIQQQQQQQTTHAVSPGGAAELIWGPEPSSPKSSWSPVSNITGVWDQSTRQKSPVPSAEEVQRLKEEKAKGEAEKREVELMALKRKEEEKRQMLKKKEEEERLQREAVQRENELRLKKQKEEEEEEEEEEMRREKERRRQEIQKQVEAEKRKETAKQKKKAQQEQKQRKESEEQKQKQNEIRDQQKQALMRLQQQQQELQRREQQIQERAEQKKLERQIQEDENAQQLQQHLQQKRMQQSNSASKWGRQSPPTLSLSAIQEQEEKNRRAHQERMEELAARQRELQSVATAGHGWADNQSNPSSVKSLKAIQDEQSRQLRTQKNKPAPRTQPAPVSSPGAWANSWTAGNNNVWSGVDLADEDEHGEKDTGFWAEAGRAVSAKSQSQPQRQQARVSTTQSVANGKKSGKKATKEEESVRRIFQQSEDNDPFMEWCSRSLYGIHTSVDIPTFIAFLKEVESPYEIHSYVNDFLGDSNQAKTFAKEFIQKKAALCGAEKRTASAKPVPTAADVVPRGGGGANRTLLQNEAELKENSVGNAKNKKKKKQRMQKVDPSILGFSVNAAAERVNMGEIQSVDDS